MEQGRETSSKQEIRKILKKKRGMLTVSRILLYSHQILEKLLAEPMYQQADVILAYMSFASEVDTRYLIEKALQQGKQVAVPRCTDRETMEFYYITSRTQLSPGSYGIMEPTTSEKVDATDGKQYLCLVPGIGFDLEGNRLGYGGGYYDRYFKRYPDIGRIMLAYEMERVDRLPRESFDMPVQIILTEVSRYEAGATGKEAYI